MTHAEKVRARQRRLNAITASAPTGEPITANWEAEFTLTAIAAPNPAAALDVPDGNDDKTAPKTGVDNAPNGKKQRDAKGNPPTARFNITAYNGGPMKLNGYKFPVIVDGTGIKAAASNLPIYVGHCQSWDSPANQMEQLIG